MSNQAELTVELSASYAHRTGEDIHVVLTLTDDVPADTAARLQLRAGRKVVRVAATPTVPAAPATAGDPGDAAGTDGSAGLVLDARVPAAELRPGVWSVGLVGSDGAVTPVEARLLNSRKQPIALLPGPVPRTVLAPPQRVAPPAPSAGKARVYATASKIANRGLSMLPDQQASKYRSVLKKAGRRVLG
jgi:hypothetical protein